jgi:hypothetical protein
MVVVFNGWGYYLISTLGPDRNHLRLSFGFDHQLDVQHASIEGRFDRRRVDLFGKQDPPFEAAKGSVVVIEVLSLRFPFATDPELAVFETEFQIRLAESGHVDFDHDAGVVLPDRNSTHTAVTGSDHGGKRALQFPAYTAKSGE